MLLTQYATRYLSEAVGVSSGYAAEILRAASQLQEWAGDPLSLSELSAPLIVAWMRYRTTQADSPTTVNNKRRMVLTLWRDAADSALAPPVPRVRRLPEPEDEPEAWTVDEVGHLLYTCQRLRGAVACIPEADWWDALFTATYWTGCRIGALRQSLTVDYDPATGWLRVRGRTVKTRRGKCYQLPPHAQVKLLRIYSRSRELLWPWPYNHYTLWKMARRIIESAGLPCPKTGRQLFHRLRRTNLSYCAAVDIGIAQRQAGHSTPELTRRHYVDPRIALQVQASSVIPTPQF